MTPPDRDPPTWIDDLVGCILPLALTAAWIYLLAVLIKYALIR